MSCEISVLMGVFNEREELLRKSIDSILDQTFHLFEFVIINDNPSSELNKKLLDDYQKKDKRIVVLHNRANMGLTKSLNAGIKKAKGKYIARMDADDISLPARLETQYTFMEQNKDYAACGSDIFVMNEHGNKLKPFDTSFSDKSIREIFPLKNPIYHPTLFLRKESLLKNQIDYSNHYKYAQDYELLRQLLKVGRICNLKEKLLFYRVSANQISNSKFQEQHRFANLTRLKYIKETFGVNEELSVGQVYEHIKGLRTDSDHNRSLVNNAVLSILVNFDPRLKAKIYLKELLSLNFSFREKAKLLLCLLKR